MGYLCILYLWLFQMKNSFGLPEKWQILTTGGHSPFLLQIIARTFGARKNECILSEGDPHQLRNVFLKFFFLKEAGHLFYFFIIK